MDRSRKKLPVYIVLSILLIVLGPALLSGVGSRLGAMFAVLFFEDPGVNDGYYTRTLVLELMLENARLREAAMKTALYRELLGYVRLPETRALVARVLYRTEGLVGGGFVLDRGSRDSVVTGSVCIAAAGLVGIVDQVEERTCTVLPITLPGVFVSAVCGESGAMGLVSSSADGRLGMSHVDQAVPPRVGEQVLTSRFGGVYPDGIVIGTVTSVEEGARGLDIALRIEPAVDFRRIGEVLILLPYYSTP